MSYEVAARSLVDRVPYNSRANSYTVRTGTFQNHRGRDIQFAMLQSYDTVVGFSFPSVDILDFRTWVTQQEAVYTQHPTFILLDTDHFSTTTKQTIEGIRTMIDQNHSLFSTVERLSFTFLRRSGVLQRHDNFRCFPELYSPAKTFTVPLNTRFKKRPFASYSKFDYPWSSSIKVDTFATICFRFCNSSDNPQLAEKYKVLYLGNHMYGDFSCPLDQLEVSEEIGDIRKVSEFDHESETLYPLWPIGFQ